MDESNDFVETAVRRFIFYRLLVAAIVFLVGLIGGVGFIFYWVYNEITLEMNYYHRYGAVWRVEYEKYHGSLSHAHAQIAIAVGGMVAIVAVLGFGGSRMFRKRRYRSDRG